MHLEVELSAGRFPIITVDDPGVHGEDVAGIQG